MAVYVAQLLYSVLYVANALYKSWCLSVGKDKGLPIEVCTGADNSPYFAPTTLPFHLNYIFKFL